MLRAQTWPRSRRPRNRARSRRAPPRRLSRMSGSSRTCGGTGDARGRAIVPGIRRVDNVPGARRAGQGDTVGARPARRNKRDARGQLLPSASTPYIAAPVLASASSSRTTARSSRSAPARAAGVRAVLAYASARAAMTSAGVARVSVTSMASAVRWQRLLRAARLSSSNASVTLSPNRSASIPCAVFGVGLKFGWPRPRTAAGRRSLHRLKCVILTRRGLRAAAAEGCSPTSVRDFGPCGAWER